MSSVLYRIFIFAIFLSQSECLSAQSEINRANWKLFPLQALDSQNDVELENNLLNAIDHLDAISVDPSTSRSISVQLNEMSNNGMLIYNILI